MAASKLTFAQQLALQPATIPESVLDVLLDFTYSETCQNTKTVAAFAPDYLAQSKDSVVTALQLAKAELRSPEDVTVRALAPQVPGAFACKVANGVKSIGVGIQVSQHLITKIIVHTEAYDESSLIADLKKT